MKKLNLNENFISRIWVEKKHYEGLKTTDGSSVEILEYGVRNKDSGADFKDARISIDGSIFCGDIEIHRSHKDWFLHKHKGDDKYNKVILQVVFWEDDFTGGELTPKASRSRKIPTVVLSKFLNKSIHEIWKEIIENPSLDFKLPCYPESIKIESEIKSRWVKNLGNKRLNYRSERLKNRLEELEKQTGSNYKKYNWERIFFEYTLEALGFSKNKEQFLKFAGNLDFGKIKNAELKDIELEALFFGAAGFLFGVKYKDDYITEIKKSWDLVKEKLKPIVMNKAEWNFFRLRPQNFPTIRMAYAVSFFKELTKKDFFKRVIYCFEKSKNTKKDITELFSSIPLPDYWQRHYVFGRETNSNISSIGGERIKDIITNVILPLLFLYSVKFGKNDLRCKILHYYENTTEKQENEITKIMQKQIEVKASSISDYQGLIHLHNFYCIKEKCRECEIGKIRFNSVKEGDMLRIILY